MPEFANRIDAIPMVSGTAERAGLFPNPATGQRVHNIGTDSIDRWNGTSWVSMPLTVATNANLQVSTLVATTTVTVPLGTAAAPSVLFTGDTNTGVYSPGADQVGLTAGGNARLLADATGVTLLGTTNINGDVDILGENVTVNLDGLGSTAVTYGANDSAGAGYRVLRVLNA
jgi:hypothetical protein